MTRITIEEEGSTYRMFEMSPCFNYRNLSETIIPTRFCLILRPKITIHARFIMYDASPRLVRLFILYLYAKKNKGFYSCGFYRQKIGVFCIALENFNFCEHFYYHYYYFSGRWEGGITE